MSNYNALYVKYKTKYVELVGGMKRAGRPAGFEFGSMSQTRIKTPVEIEDEILRCESPKISEIIPGLFLGNESNASSMCSRVGAILNMTPKNSRCDHPEHNQSYLQIPLQDFGGQQIEKYFSQTNAFIDGNIANNIYIHCQMGVSRSATIVIAYLMWKMRMSLDNAIQYVKSKRPCIKPNIDFIESLRMYEMQLQSGAMPYSS